MAKSQGHGSEWYRSRAKLLKGWGLVDMDLRRTKTGAFSASEKRRISSLWKKTEPIHRKSTSADKILDVKAIKVKKSDKTGHRMRVGNTIFVAREGASRVTLNRKTGQIVKSVKQNGSRKIIRAPINPQAADLAEQFSKLAKNQTGMIRSATGKGITSGGTAFDKNTFQHYKAWKLEAIAAAYNKPGRNADGSPRKKMNKRDARKKAREILDDWYVVEVEEDEK